MHHSKVTYTFATIATTGMRSTGKVSLHVPVHSNLRVKLSTVLVHSSMFVVHSHTLASNFIWN